MLGNHNTEQRFPIAELAQKGIFSHTNSGLRRTAAEHTLNNAGT